jgi:hypothetical protein
MRLLAGLISTAASVQIKTSMSLALAILTAAGIEGGPCFNRDQVPFFSLFPWDTRAALSSVLGGEEIPQVFEVFNSLTQARHLGSQLAQRRLMGSLWRVTHRLPSSVSQHTRE